MYQIQSSKLVIRILKEPNEDLNSVKKNPVRNKGYTNCNEE